MLTYSPYAGWFFVSNTVTPTQRIAYASSWGLLDTGGTPTLITWIGDLILGARTLGWIG